VTKVKVYTGDVSMWGSRIHIVKKHTEALLIDKEIGLEIMLIKLSTWSCLEIRMFDEATI